MERRSARIAMAHQAKGLVAPKGRSTISRALVIPFAMPQNWRDRLAVERAEKYAPKPTGGAFMAGVALAGAALLGDFAFSAFYGWRVPDHMLIAALVTALGFLVGITGHWRLARLSRRARHAELANINRYVSSRGEPNTKPRREQG